MDVVHEVMNVIDFDVNWEVQELMMLQEMYDEVGDPVHEFLFYVFIIYYMEIIERICVNICNILPLPLPLPLPLSFPLNPELKNNAAFDFLVLDDVFDVLDVFDDIVLDCLGDLTLYNDLFGRLGNGLLIELSAFSSGSGLVSLLIFKLRLIIC